MTIWFRKFNWDLMKHIIIVLKYILELSSELCSNPCSQKSMKSMVAMSENHASVFQFDFNASPSPLLP